MIALIADTVYVDSEERGFVLDAYVDFFHRSVEPAEREPWFMGPVSVAEANQVLAQADGQPGAFVVRDDSENPDMWWLDIVSDDMSAVKTFHIFRTDDDFVQLEGSDAAHSHIRALIEYYAQPEQNELECPLSIDWLAARPTEQHADELSFVSEHPSWLVLGAPRRAVLDALRGQPEGTFAIRGSQTHPYWYNRVLDFSFNRFDPVTC